MTHRVTRTKPLVNALILAFGSAMLMNGAYAQTEQKLERVEVTGSGIKRTNTEGPAPVEIITRKEIQRTGATSVNELLRNIPSVDIFDQGELASNSPAGSGTANIRMRGLSSSEVLVLLNGRRLPVNALYDSSGAGAAFDINSLPIGAIERIEILKDGGSAIYGADAVAGVINFITKTDYQGGEIVANYGTSSRSDGKETRLGLSAGYGDLTKDRVNVLFGLDYLKRDPIYRKDRDISKSVDFRSVGGFDGRSSFAPSGNVVNPNTGGFVGVPYSACPADSLVTTNMRCRYDFNKSLLTAYNGADRLSAMAIATAQISASTKAFAEITYSTSKDHFEAHPVPDYFVVPITNENQRPYEIPADWGLGTNKVYIAGRFMQGGPRITDRTSDLVNSALGLEGVVGSYDWKASISHGESKVTNKDKNYYDYNKWSDATSSGAINPTINTNPTALVESLKVQPVRDGRSKLTTFSGQISGDLTQLPAGVLRFAAGLSALRESLVDTPDALTQAGEVVGSIAQAAVNASRTAKAVYGELAIPVTRNIEAQAAVRYDSYPNSSATSPKFAAKWAVMPEFAVRGSYTKSFRAPVLKQLYGATEEGAINITRPEHCTIMGVPLDANGGCNLAAFQVNGSNPNLKPEIGKTANVGIVFEASKNISASVDWWRVQKSDDISSPTIGSAIEQHLFTKVGPRFYISTQLRNIAQRETSGVDIDARMRFPGTALGNVTVRNLLTYYSSNKTRSNAASEWAEFSGTYIYPRFRNGLNVTFEKGPWTVGSTLKTVGGFWDADYPHPIDAGTRMVGTFEEVDLQVQYSGLKGIELTFGVKNLLDRMPPLSLTNASDNQYTQMGFAELYTARGRFFYLSAKYNFR